MFASGIDDLALLAVIGSVLTGAFEELDIQTANNSDESPLKDFFDKDKDGFSKWFNFLKHGARGPRSPGDEFDFSFLGEQPDRDVNLFGLIWQASLYHLSAYECSTELIDTILIMGNLLWGYEDEEINQKDNTILRENIKKIAGSWYSRHERAKESGVDIVEAQATLRESFAGPVAQMLSTFPKRPIRNRNKQPG